MTPNPAGQEQQPHPADATLAEHDAHAEATDTNVDQPSAAPAAAPGAGWLALVATPIGNLGDITLRALEALRAADLIAAEDTRRAGNLCRHYKVRATLTPYHAHNEHRRTEWLLDQVAAGRRVAVLTDAGTPGVSDPGFLLVRQALARGLEPVVIPGVSALTCAVVASGLPVDRFTFVGFPPVKSGRRQRFWEALRDRRTTVFLFEAPHRIARLLEEVRDILGPDSPMALLREATKLHEECLRGTVAEILAKHGTRSWRGEFTVAIGAPPRNTDAAAGEADEAETDTPTAGPAAP